MTEIRTFKISCPAKLNLTFNIVGSLPDGYHEVETLLQAIDLEDELRFVIQASDKNSFSIKLAEDCSPTDFPLNNDNLIGKAFALFMERYDKAKIAVEVEARKIIPIAAGMGGGSSNAASVLLLLNRYFSSPFSKTQLEEMAAELGADVPFFIHGGTQIGRHRGDKLATVATVERMYFTIVNPREISIATPWIFKQYDEFIKSATEMPSIVLKNAQSAREDGNVPLAARSFLNVFEPIVFKYYPEMEIIKQKILDLGAVGCGMTGSGPTLFAICDSQRLAGAMAKELKKTTLEGTIDGVKRHIPFDVWPAMTIDRGPTVMETSPHSVRQRK